MSSTPRAPVFNLNSIQVKAAPIKTRSIVQFPLANDRDNHQLLKMVVARKRSTRNETRERIMLKADELFRQFGFGKTTVADVASELDMSPANIYKFFPSKDAIIQASADRNLAVLSEQIQRDANQPGPVLERIERIFLRIYRHISDTIRNERQIFKLLSLCHDEKWECIRQFDKFMLKTLTELVQQGMETEEFRPGNASVFAHLLFDSLTLVMTPHLYQRERTGIEYGSGGRAGTICWTRTGMIFFI